jgi:hypothetical protein
MEQEKLRLMQKIDEMQSEILKLKESKDKVKEDSLKKSSEMKGKLEKAF